jgi:aminoglycoside phosphotransferase (APT) family kinase protein
MGTRPAAEVEVTTDLVHDLLAEQHPDLAGLPLRVVATGWDNVLLRLGDGLAVRVPRRRAAAVLVEHEQRWLPVLAPRLGVPVPVPVRVGRPSLRFGWSWSVVAWWPGRTAASVPPAARRAVAPALADLLVRLHTPAPVSAPHNPVRGVPLASRDPAVRERLASGSVPEPARVGRLWDAALATPPWTGPPLWLHGDLHPANLLLTADGRLAAVLDFGDLTAGDPATDLATAWLTLDTAGRAAFRAHLLHADPSGPASDPATWARARGWALCLATAMLVHSDDDRTVARLGGEALAHVLAG